MRTFPLSENANTFQQGKGRQFLVLDAIYLLAVFSWTLFIPPLGRDYAVLAEFAPFGSLVPIYHLLNLLLLYSMMVLVFFLTRIATLGPWWLGSVAAVIFMAHPAKAESALNLCGAWDLFPSLLSMATILVYARARNTFGPLTLVISLVLFTCAVLPFPSQGGLLFAILAWEKFIVPPDRRSWLVVSPFPAVAIAGWFMHPPAIAELPFGFSGACWPLVYLVYPIGLIPDTALIFQTNPVLPLFIFGCGVLGLMGLARIVRHPGFNFGMFSALAFVVFREAKPVDPVHLIGGGCLVSAIALFAVATAALFHRILHHPAWPKPVVFMTTALCLLLMGLHIQVNLSWVRAGKEVGKFRLTAETTAKEHPNKKLAVLPDYRYCEKAPLLLSESIQHNNPFGKALSVESIAAYDPETTSLADFSLIKYGPNGAAFRVVSKRPLTVTGPSLPPMAPRLGILSNWHLLLTPRSESTEERPVEIRMVPNGPPFPEFRIEFP